MQSLRMFRFNLPLLHALLMAFLAGAARAADGPAEWIEPATGHRLVRLSREPGTTKLYFHQNAFTAGRDRGRESREVSGG